MGGGLPPLPFISIEKPQCSGGMTRCWWYEDLISTPLLSRSKREYWLWSRSRTRSEPEPDPVRAGARPGPSRSSTRTEPEPDPVRAGAILLSSLRMTRIWPRGCPIGRFPLPPSLFKTLSSYSIAGEITCWLGATPQLDGLFLRVIPLYIVDSSSTHHPKVCCMYSHFAYCIQIN